jgi:hypothetical protein
MPHVMKTTSLFLTLAAIGCGDPGTGMPDLAAPSDLSGAADMTRDMSMLPCTKLGAWPGLKPEGFFDPDFFGSGPATVALSRSTNSTPWNELSVEAWHSAVYPTTVTFKANDTYEFCDTCVIYAEGCDDQGCAALYFAQGGTGTITQASQDLAGTMKASAANLKLVEWDFMSDTPVANARCVEITSASWDVAWNDTDGGARD